MIEQPSSETATVTTFCEECWDTRGFDWHRKLGVQGLSSIDFILGGSALVGLFVGAFAFVLCRRNPSSGPPLLPAE